MTKWRKTVDINQFIRQYYDGLITWESCRNLIVDTLKKDKGFSEDCECAIEDMEQAETIEEFDEVLKDIYDYADVQRIWLGL